MSEANAKRADDTNGKLLALTKEFFSFANQSQKNLMDKANKHNENMSEAQKNLKELSKKKYICQKPKRILRPKQR